MSAHKVLLGPTELLEGILKFLPNEEVLKIMSVCKRFATVIKASTTQRKLFFEAEKWNGRDPTEVRLNPLLIGCQSYGPLPFELSDKDSEVLAAGCEFEDPQIDEYDSDEGGWPKAYLVLGKDTTDHRIAYPADASAWEMYLTQPPVTAGTIDWIVEISDGVKEYLPETKVLRTIVVRKEGLRLRDFVNRTFVEKYGGEDCKGMVMIGNAALYLTNATTDQELNEWERKEDAVGVTLQLDFRKR